MVMFGKAANPEASVDAADAMLVRTTRSRTMRSAAVMGASATVPQKRRSAQISATQQGRAEDSRGRAKTKIIEQREVVTLDCEDRLEVESPAKKTSTPRKKRNPPPPSPPSTPARPLIPLHTAPALLPATLPFSLPAAISHLSEADPRFGLLYQHIPLKPFQPPLQPVDPFRTLVTSIIGQQVSWLAARAITGRFRALWGYEGEEGFPTPLEVAEGDVGGTTYRGVGFSQRKAEYVVAIAEHFVSGQLSTELLRDGSDEEIAKALIAVRGIGQWTVDMFLMFSLRRPDVLPVGDLGVQKGLLRWALSAHGALPRKDKKEGRKADAVREKYKKGKKSETTEMPVLQDRVEADGTGEIDTLICTPPPDDRRAQQEGMPPTPFTPGNEGQTTIKLGVLHTPAPSKRGNGPASHQQLPSTPLTPGNVSALASVQDSRSTSNASPAAKVEETLEVPGADLPPPAPDQMMLPPTHDPMWDADRAAPLQEGLSLEVLKSRLSGKKVKGGAYLTPKEMEVLTDHWRPYRSVGVYYMWPAGEEF